MGVVVLDGRRLAARRAPMIAARAAAVRARRGHAPRLLLMAFPGENGRVPHVQGKLRACAAAGVAAVPVIVRPDAGTREAVAALRGAIETHEPDGVFVQIPFPAGLDGDAIARAIPVGADVDVMTPHAFERFMADADALPPVTIAAALLLLAEHGVGLGGRRGIIVAEPSPFAAMFRAALERRGARMHPLVSPAAPDLAAAAGSTGLVVVAVGRPAALHTGMLAAGAIAIDVGYFNEGGRGDIDTATGVAHLAAIMPVPGGIGPMTVSALIERVVLCAES